MPSIPSQAAALLTKAGALEAAGDFAGAIVAYEAALGEAPGNSDIVAGLANLAGRIGMHEAAARLWRGLLDADELNLEAIDGLARSLRDLDRFDEAIEIVSPVLSQNSADARLWITLGTIVNQKGDSGSAIAFFDEAVRLDPASAVALYNRGGVRFDLVELEAAKADFTAARAVAADPGNAAMIDFAAATLALCQGDLTGGWDAYEARLSPHYSHAMRFEAPGRPWTPDTPLEGAHLLVLAEQGLGDEVLFANMVTDVIAALGPSGRLSLAVAPRLVSLFQRSFPGAAVSAYATTFVGQTPCRSAPGVADPNSVNWWAPLASLTRRFRRTLADFPAPAGYLIPDPVAVARWRNWLGSGPPAVGLSWRSGRLLGERGREFPALADWTPLLTTPNLRLVNLQYGATPEELTALGEIAGSPLVVQPGLDLKDDLDGVAALTLALDLTVTVPNATAALAAASGAPVCFLGGQASWPRLGTAAYPWYPQASSFSSAGYGDWSGAVAAAAALARVL